jgi:hypothetical protein
MRVGVTLIAALFAAFAQPTVAQAQAPDGKMPTFTNSDFYKGLINRALAGLPPTVFQRCPTLVSNGSRIVVLKPVSFAADGFPNAGLWRQSFPVSGCGNDTILNFYFSAGADEKIDTMGGISGETRADLALQRDAVTYASVGARFVETDCKAFDVKNSKFEGFGLKNPPTADPGPDNRFRPWWETWTLVGCGHTIDVPIDFVPNEKGTQIIQPGGSVKR